MDWNLCTDISFSFPFSIYIFFFQEGTIRNDISFLLLQILETTYCRIIKIGRYGKVFNKMHFKSST